jgi:mannose-6-phosphate isomerase-like protein (cupin superfamily)
MADTIQGQRGARVQTLDSEQGYQPLLEGCPETCGMRSGFVTLEPDAEVGRHNTKGYEETLIFLEGAGTLAVEGQEPLAAGAGQIAYIPPRTGHNVVNTGEVALRYIYVVAPAAQE